MTDKVFISMPFGNDPDSPDNEWTKLYNHGLKPLENPIPNDANYQPVLLLRADKNLRDLGLKNNVKKLIEEATIVIGVLTTIDYENDLKISNPNVLWEIGYAEAIGKPIVVLADNQSLRNLPVLAGVPNVCVYNHKLVQTSKPSEAPTTLSIVAQNLSAWVTQACQDERRGQSSGIRARATTYAKRDDINLAEMIAVAREHIDILTTNVQYFLTGKFMVTTEAEHPFASALKNGASVRIVTMDPESVIAEYRARQLGRGDNVPGYRNELREGIIFLQNLFGNKPNFWLKIYNDLPLQITTRVEQSIFTSIVTRGDQARKRIQIQFNYHDQGVIESFVSHFQSMFEDSKDVRGVTWVLRPSSQSKSNQ